MAVEYICCSLRTRKNVFLRQPIKKDGLLRQPIACYEIVKRTCNFVMTYVGNCTINITHVMLFLVGNKIFYYRELRHNSDGPAADEVFLQDVVLRSSLLLADLGFPWGKQSFIEPVYL